VDVGRARRVSAEHAPRRRPRPGHPDTRGARLAL